MNTGQRQSGMSIPGMLAILLMLGFFAMCAIRMSPPFFEFLSVKKIIAGIVVDPDIDTSPVSIRDIRRKIDNIFNTNQIYLLDPNDVEIFNRDGKTYVDANYEVRLPIMWRIDAVLKFDDLFYEVGKPEPVPPLPAPKKYK